MKGKYKVCILADRSKTDDLNDRYSFIDNLDRGKFERVRYHEQKPHFYVIDLDMPADDLEEFIVQELAIKLVCRPIIIVSFDRDQHGHASAKVAEKLPFLRHFCKTSSPCCESAEDLKESLRWFRFIFKDELLEPPKRSSAADESIKEMHEYNLQAMKVIKDNR